MIIFISFWKFAIFVWSFIVFTIPCFIYNAIATIFGWKQIDLTNNEHFNLYFISFIAFIFVILIVLVNESSPSKKEIEEKYEHLQWEKEFKLEMDRERLEREREIEQLYKDAEGQRIQSINMELEKLGLQFKNIELKNYNVHTAYIQKDNKINVYRALLETEYKSFKFQISCIIFEKLELNSENLKSGIETYTTGNSTYSIHPDDLDIDMLNSSNKDYINKYGCPENKNYKWFLENKKIFDKY